MNDAALQAMRDLAEVMARVQSIQPTYLFEIMRVMEAKCRAAPAQPANMQPGRPFHLDVQMTYFTSSGIEGRVVDPFDNRAYRLRLEPLPAAKDST